MLDLKNLKKSYITQLEDQYNLRINQSIFINNFQQALQAFPELGKFQTWGKELLTEFEKQLEMLAKLGTQLHTFKDTQTNLTKTVSEIQNSFDSYDKLVTQNKAKLLKLFTQKTLLHFQEKNGLFKELLEKKTLFQNDDSENLFEACIQSIKNYVRNPEKLSNFIQIAKISFDNKNEQAISGFIFVALNATFSQLQKNIKNNFSELNIEKIKHDCENQNLYITFYQDYLVNLVNHYQDYSNKLDMIKNKLEFLNKHLGEPVTDWLNDYTTLSDTAFLSEATLEILVEKCKNLSSFETQLNLNNDNEFLKKVKNETQYFLNKKINQLEQQFQNSQTRITKLAKSPLGTYISNKLLQTQEAHYIAIKEIWIKRQKRLASINVIEELKNFKNHFPKENSFDSDSLKFNELSAAILFLEESDLVKQTEMFTQNFLSIPLENLTEEILFILENLSDTLLPNSINNLLQFIHSENSDPTITASKAHLVISLQDFFNRQPTKMALCIANTAPLNRVINTETYEKLITILGYTDSHKLENWSDLNLSLRLKIKELSDYNEIYPTKIDQMIDRLISTNKIIHLFAAKNPHTTYNSENNTSLYSLWDACCLFQQFAKNSFPLEFPYLKELKKTPTNKDELFGFQNAVMNLDWFIKTIQKLENQSYTPTLFLKSGKLKHTYVNELINKLKNISITEVDTSSINSTFEQWKKDHQLMIDEPRYRLLTKLCMLIYRQFMKIFFPASNCFTNSHQTVDELQKEFLEASEHLQNLRNSFTDSVQDETTAARLTCFPPAA